MTIDLNVSEKTEKKKRRKISYLLHLTFYNFQLRKLFPLSFFFLFSLIYFRLNNIAMILSFFMKRFTKHEKKNSVK